MPDLSAALRNAIIGHLPISAHLAQWSGEPAVFTRVPVPEETPYPLCVIPAAISITDFDGLNSSRPIVQRDIIFYGRKGGAGNDDYRIIEQMAFEARRLFHRQKFSAIPNGFAVVDIRVNGPTPAPVDDEKTVARMVSLIIRLREI
jgi:hypothetical protein